MKTIVVGDLHLKQSKILPLVERAVARHGAERVVLCGDYVDEFGATDEDELRELKYMAGWLEERRGEGLAVDALLGNHDFAYLMGREISGHRPTAAPSVRWLLQELRLDIATTVGDILVTHAGLTASWARAHHEVLGRSAGEAEDVSAAPDAEVIRAALDTLYRKGEDSSAWASLFSVGPARGGWQRPGPLWADARELVTSPVPGLRQIVGHTPIETCACLSVNPEIWACDTFSCYRSGEPIGDGTALLVDDDGSVTPVGVYEEE